MNTTLPPLDAEQTVALTQLASKLDTPELWASTVLIGLINEQVLRNIIAKGEQIIAAAQQLPDDKRLQFTADVEKAYLQAAQ